MVYYPAGSKEEEAITCELERRTKEIKEKKPKDLPKEAVRVSFEKKEDSISESSSKNKIVAMIKSKDPFKKSGKMKKIIFLVVFLLLLGGGFFFFKTKNLVSRISTSGGSLFGGMFKDKEDVGGVKEGRINVLLVGMRGTNMPGGSLLADTIMLASFKPGENKVALISIPRDLFVEMPGKNYSRKINEANVLGEENGKGKGLEAMKEVVGSITGLPIHYAVSADFNALRETVDILGGITVHLDKPFFEGKQFVEGNECGGEFSLPAGDISLSGDKALCYSRARFATSDFDRARRQQDVLLAIKEKALDLGTLTNFNKLNELLGVMGNDIRTDMEPWEMQELFGILQGIKDPKFFHKVFDTSKDGLLYSSDNGSYILLPVGDNYDKMREASKNVFEEKS
jgi:LCP family protein required for cell wall assembly